MLRRALVSAALAVAVAGCIDDVEIPSAPIHAPIVNGTAAPADDAVVALTVSGQHFCTGTLVRSNIVVTAAHCLPPNLEVPAQAIEVYFGPTVFDGGELVGVEAALAHPAWNIDAIADDIGVIALESPVSVTPIPMRTQPMTGLAGAEMRLVGYGITSEGGFDNGTRRQGTGTIDDVDASTIVLAAAPSATCNGDSGGAAFIAVDGVEQLAGVHSRSDCASFYLDERVDRHIDDFIMPFIAEHSGIGCGDDGTCNAECDSDPDCGPVCEADGACVAECAPGADPDCGPVCEADGMCVAECAAGEDPDCGPVCEADGACVAECPADGAGADPDCAAPADDDDDDGGGCRVGGNSSGAGWLVIACCVFGLRRRRR